mgnify:CR=1 FL=1
MRPARVARVAAKGYRNGVLNENAFRRKPLSVEEILGSPMLNYPLTQYMFCSPDEGAAAVLDDRALASVFPEARAVYEDFVAANPTNAWGDRASAITSR